MTDITNKLEFVNGNSIRYFFYFQSVFERRVESGNSLENTGGLER